MMKIEKNIVVSLTEEEIEDIIVALQRLECASRLCFYGLIKKLDDAVKEKEKLTKPCVKVNGVLLE